MCVARLILNVLTQPIVGCILLTGIRMALKPALLWISRVMLSYSMVTAFALGWGR